MLHHHDPRNIPVKSSHDSGDRFCPSCRGPDRYDRCHISFIARTPVRLRRAQNARPLLCSNPLGAGGFFQAVTDIFIFKRLIIVPTGDKILRPRMVCLILKLRLCYDNCRDASLRHELSQKRDPRHPGQIMAQKHHIGGALYDLVPCSVGIVRLRYHIKIYVRAENPDKTPPHLKISHHKQYL